MSEEKIKTDGSNIQSENFEEEMSFEERFQKAVLKLKPYIVHLWEKKKKFLFFNFVIAVLAILYLLFLTKPYYKSSVTILPDFGNNLSTLSQLSGLASLAGINVGQNSATQIYQSLITSEAILNQVIYKKYKTEKYQNPVDLIQYFEIKSDKSLPPNLQKREIFLKELSKLQKGAISTDLDRVTQILSITVTMPEAQLSADVVNMISKSLENYVQTQRKSYALDQVKYIEKRIGQIKDSLNIAENTLTIFNEQNRVISQSPQLQLRQSRLMRNVDILNGVYLELRKQLELSKIDEINDTPIVNVQEYAKNPVIKAGPRRTLLLVVIMFFSVLFSAGYYAISDAIKGYYFFLKTSFKHVEKE